MYRYSHAEEDISIILNAPRIHMFENICIQFYGNHMVAKRNDVYCIWNQEKILARLASARSLYRYTQWLASLAIE